ncbi:pseudouridine synthase [Pseudoclavibacter soli]|uniref:pseudouridine synthase n=1 Tax=Pseudoclavibacter soli TaxID=452623 RepID=UPI00040D9AAF|nr:pseudouridine synthase [Pseudoclavibacter soli]
MTNTHDTAANAEGQRLQKVMAQAGVASRRASEELIVAGRVRVNGQVARELGTRVDPLRDRIEVDGLVIVTDPDLRYYLLNKPAGVVSTMHDEQGRPDLSQYVTAETGRIFNVGRLDEATRGLLLLTNDGELAHRLMHPSFEIEKVYLALVRGTVQPGTLAKLRDGVQLDDGPIAVDRARVVDRSEGRSLVEVTLHSGRNRIVRRMLAAVGHPVIDLLRRSVGPVRLGDLAEGAMRPLTDREVGSLLKATTDK